MARRRSSGQPALKDWHLWTEVTRSVSPLRPAPPLPVETAAAGPRPTGPGKQALPAWSPQSRASHAPGSAALTRATRREPDTPPGRVIEPGMRRRLMRGHVPIDGTIDLHGLRQHEAHAALCRFIVARYASGDRTLLVITGKGLKRAEPGRIVQKGVLRAMLPIWLGEKSIAPMIAGWEQSAQVHGGEGAWYIRLKRPQK
jgi:DNA-nicking Smr family endonuclease